MLSRWWWLCLSQRQRRRKSPPPPGLHGNTANCCFEAGDTVTTTSSLIEPLDALVAQDLIYGRREGPSTATVGQGKRGYEVLFEI